MKNTSPLLKSIFKAVCMKSELKFKIKFTHVYLCCKMTNLRRSKEEIMDKLNNGL